MSSNKSSSEANDAKSKGSYPTTNKPSVSPQLEPSITVANKKQPKRSKNQNGGEIDRFKIYVSNVPADMTDDRFKVIFEQFGPIRNAYVCSSKRKGRFLYGFVSFEEISSAKKAVEAQKVVLKKACMTIKQACQRAGLKKYDGGKKKAPAKLPSLLELGPVDNSQEAILKELQDSKRPHLSTRNLIQVIKNHKVGNTALRRPNQPRFDDTRKMMLLQTLLFQEIMRNGGNMDMDSLMQNGRFQAAFQPSYGYFQPNIQLQNTRPF